MDKYDVIMVLCTTMLKHGLAGVDPETSSCVSCNECSRVMFQLRLSKNSH